MAWAGLTDVRCFYTLLGQGDPLLLVSGLGVTSRVWDPIVPELAEHFSLIIPDNRGVGFSEARRKACSLGDYTSDLVELLDYLQVDRAHVLGLSLGGVMAIKLAAEHPERINRLVLASCTDRFTPYLREVAMLLGQTLGRLRPGAFARTVEVLGSAPEYLDAQPNLIAERVRQKREEHVPAREVARQLRCVANAAIELERDPIMAPTLVIAGEHDVLIPSCYARGTAGRIAGSRFWLVEGAGHNPLVERPGEVLPEVIEFLEGGSLNEAGERGDGMEWSNRVSSFLAGGHAS
jgi:pimeloyl-ACP methyl ester carboxylesterase